MKTDKNKKRGHSPPTAKKRSGAAGRAPASRASSQKQRRTDAFDDNRRPPNGRVAVNPTRDRDAAMRARARRRKQLIRRRKFIVYSIILLLVVSAAVVFSFTMLFHIEKIEVQGNSRYASQNIIDKTEIKIQDKLFLSNTGKAEEAILEAFPYIKEVKVKRAFPSGIVINVTETYAAFAIEYEGKLSLLDPDGRVLETGIGDPPDGLPVITGLEITDITPGQDIQFKEENIAACLRKITAAVNGCEIRKSDFITESTPLSERGDIEIIDMSDTLNITLIFDGRLNLELGMPTDLEYKLQFAKSAIDKLAEDARGTLNLSVLKKATFSPDRSHPELPTQPEQGETDGEGDKDVDDDKSDTAIVTENNDENA